MTADEERAAIVIWLRSRATHRRTSELSNRPIVH